MSRAKRESIGAHIRKNKGHVMCLVFAMKPIRGPVKKLWKKLCVTKLKTPSAVLLDNYQEVLVQVKEKQSIAHEEYKRVVALSDVTENVSAK